MSNDNIKVQVIGSELTGWMDALQRIADATKDCPAMFVGGPKPADVALTLKIIMEDKLKQAPQISAPAARPTA